MNRHVMSTEISPNMDSARPLARKGVLRHNNHTARIQLVP